MYMGKILGGRNASFLQAFGDIERGPALSIYDINIQSTAFFLGGLGIQQPPEDYSLADLIRPFETSAQRRLSCTFMYCFQKEQHKSGQKKTKTLKTDLWPV